MLRDSSACQEKRHFYSIIRRDSSLNYEKVVCRPRTVSTTLNISVADNRLIFERYHDTHGVIKC